MRSISAMISSSSPVWRPMNRTIGRSLGASATPRGGPPGREIEPGAARYRDVQGRTSGARRRGGVLDPLIRNCGMLAEADGEFRLQSPGVAFSMT
jgi:hypothetical protein